MFIQCWSVRLQPLCWHCVECAINHERVVREEQCPYFMWHKQGIIEWSRLCCLLPQCEALRTWCLVFPITAICWCCGQDVNAMPSAAFTKRTSDCCGSLYKGGNVVATSPLALCWMCDSPRMGSAQIRTTPIYLYVAWTSKWSRGWSLFIVACYHKCEALRICRSGFVIATRWVMVKYALQRVFEVVVFQIYVVSVLPALNTQMSVTELNL